MESGIREISQKSRFNFTLKCKTEADAIKIQQELTNSYGTSIEINAPRDTAPMVKVTNIAERVTEVEEVERTIRNSNFWATDLVFRVAEHYEVPAANGMYSNVIHTVNLESV